MNNNLNQLEKKLNIKIKNKTLFLRAFTHKSSNSILNNEKLEFLGDRVIGLILSKKLFDLYPNETEGVLDKRFAKLVNKNTCASIFWSLGLNEFVVLGDSKKNLERKDEKILSDTCEALVGAIYLEKGFSATEKIVNIFWKNEIKKSNITIIDPKTKLQEFSLRHFNKLPEYSKILKKGPHHKPTFVVSVKITQSKSYSGEGKSIKVAQQNAAKKLLSAMRIK